MTFFGNKRSGRHLLKNTGRKGKENTDGSRESTSRARRPKWSLRKKLLIIPGIIVAVLVILTGGAFAYLRWAGTQKPVVEDNPVYTNPGYIASDKNDPAQIEQPAENANNPGEQLTVDARNHDKYTFLLLATDDGANTDTIMAAAFDTESMTFDVVNIPRDTMVNVTWSLKKANSIYAYMQARHRGESDAQEKVTQDVIEEFSKVLGFRVDFMAVVNLRAFVTLVNAVGGVDFYVPVNMNYDDYDQNLHIHYSRGMQHLNGQQALEVVRFRNTYASGDIARIGVQQNFLTAALQQILAKGSSINVRDLASVFIRDVKTNIPFENLVWFGIQFLKLDADSITFEMAPGNNEDFVGLESYVTLYVDEWLELVNRKLSPLHEDITETGVSILTRGADKRLYVTDGNRVGDPSWGASSRGPSSAGSSGGTTANSASQNTQVNAEHANDGINSDGEYRQDIREDSGPESGLKEDRGALMGGDPDETVGQSEIQPSDDDGRDQNSEQAAPPQDSIAPLDEDPYEGQEIRG